ncbi:MAG: hypothetical protein HYU97_06555 [Deltaproteobacteria bacterium]|nr:hypothetical protein [Deltaproteobacteria bacterium]
MYPIDRKLETSITKLDYLLGKKVEIIAFGISYMGVLEDVDYERGTLKIADQNESATIDLERIESFGIVEN